MPTKPLIDYNIVLMMVPNVVLGINIGVIFNFMLPNLVLVILFTIFITIVFIKTSKNAYYYVKEEI